MRPGWIGSRPAWRLLFGRFVPALAGLSLLWEFGHFPLYTLWDAGSAGEIAFAAIHCTAGDVLVGGGAVMLALITTRAGPPETWRFAPIAGATVMFAMSYTMFSEWMNVEWRESWAYAAAMPTLPVLGTGVAPLLQWLVIPAIALWFTVSRPGRVQSTSPAPSRAECRSNMLDH